MEGTSPRRRLRVLLNASSGSAGAEGVQAAIEAAFDRGGFEASVTSIRGRGLHQEARKALESVGGGEFDGVAVGGGDGTVSAVAAVFAGSHIPLGILPLGTLNHFARDLGLPLALDEAVAVIASGETRTVDLADANGRVFINNSSIGIYPRLVAERERRHGHLPKPFATLAAGVRALRGLHVRRLYVRTPGGAEVYRTPLVLVGNNVYGNAGIALGRRERLDAGRLSLYIARGEGRLALLRLALRALFGGLDEERDLRSLVTEGVEISTRHGKLLVAFDGEVEIVASPLRYRILPGALQVYAG